MGDPVRVVSLEKFLREKDERLQEEDKVLQKYVLEALVEEMRRMIGALAEL